MMEAYELKSWHGFFLPDTYDTHDQWKNPSVKHDKYIFSGGWNNRDWQLLLEVAAAMPEVHFKLVTAEYLWKKADLSAPNNVELYFDLPQLRYYEMMAGATLTVCPLKNDEVSGLINIIKSMQYGIPCIATDFGVANIYYPKAYQYGQKDSLLCQPGKVDMMRLYLLHWWQMKSDDYLVKSFELQENLRTKFAPEKEMMRLMDYLHSIGWVK
jgi:glycosyltransferase involved in cell wall biosynthesis